MLVISWLTGDSVRQRTWTERASEGKPVLKPGQEPFRNQAARYHLSAHEVRNVARTDGEPGGFVHSWRRALQLCSWNRASKCGARITLSVS